MFATMVKTGLRSVMPRTEEALARLIGALTGASAVAGLLCSAVVAVGS